MANPATTDSGHPIVPTAIPNIATAVPAFIGYTPRAEINGVTCYGRPVRIRSFAEFSAWFLLPDLPPPAGPASQYRPQFHLLPQSAAVEGSLSIAGQYYAVVPDPNSIYYLYNSVRAFYRNGGSDAWIVAVGGYGPLGATPAPMPWGTALTNPNVQLDALIAGLQRLRGEPEPTLYLCPDACLLQPAAHSSLVRSQLAQAHSLGTALCLLDVRNGDQTNIAQRFDDITRFREAVGTEHLDRGACYYPFIGTDLMTEAEFDFRNLFGSDLSALKAVLSPPADPNPAAATILEEAMRAEPPQPAASQVHHNLLAASASYGLILQAIRQRANRIPASGALAGIYADVDRTRGVWVAPANVGIAGAIELPILLDEQQQAALDIDPLTGKSINVIRLLNGRGIVVFGDRTLDGNNPDWRYVQVRRTLIYIEQSIKSALASWAFAVNSLQTWQAAHREVEQFLHTLWQAGGLQGATAADAYAVAVGLGSTMTADDIQQGLMRLNVQVALIQPAEFMVLQLEQRMETGSG